VWEDLERIWQFFALFRDLPLFFVVHCHKILVLNLNLALLIQCLLDKLDLLHVSQLFDFCLYHNLIKVCMTLELNS